ncbi:MAG: type II restriction enzyme eco47ii [uncultured Sulfurovum sp.]|uniref:Type II restriction enzyme eco47ii n=1 Tax=uncultured Sulfurovum sp. TaxID=269237 RepID=A0A6S6TK17_9BACT|nr:MAG: type II restriction enzyme eco47ii [uncultured Sulfurovum sp.]
MHPYNLSFISDENLFKHVQETVEKYRFSIDLKKFNKNLVDPIKLTFDSKIYAKTLEETIELEIIRQMDKSNTNHIGYFHQNIFNYIDGNWYVPRQGFDLVNEVDKCYVEMKNKHNTMNSSSAQKTYISMQNKILKGADVQCMLVEVIAKHSQNVPWKISINSESFEHDNIRRVSMDKFYELVTGDTTAFKSLCEVLPKVLDDVLENLEQENIENTVFTELNQISPNLLKSLYLLSFSKYDGFDNLEI